MTKIQGMYEEVGGEDIGDIGEILFYSGSPDAKILIVSEAPTTERQNGGKTFFAMTKERYENGQDAGEIAKFWRDYPFRRDLERHKLYSLWVDYMLEFVDDKENNIGFTDIYKKPLDDSDLEEKLEENERHLKVLESQIDYVKPGIIVCNKKNVSKIIDERFGENKVLDLDKKLLETEKGIERDGENIRIIFSSISHVQMDRFSRKRLSDEIKNWWKK